MTDEEKKAIEDLKEELNKPLEVPEDKFNTFILCNIENVRIILNLIEKQENDYQSCMDYADSLNKDIGELLLKLEKQEKIINEMAKAIYRIDTVGEYGFNLENIIEYFTKKVEEEK